MWRCKCCRKEVTVLAVIQGLYEIFLDKDKKIIDYEDWRELYLQQAKIVEATCEHCGNSGELEEIAEWIEEE